MTQYQIGLGPKGHMSYRFLRWILGGQIRQFQADLVDPRAAQGRRLQQLIGANAETDFGRQHDFQSISNFEDFRRSVPVRTHLELLPWLDRVAEGELGVLTQEPPHMLLETSGTTGRPKHIPVTKTWEETVQMAQRLWSLGLAKEHPRMRSGKLFSLVSPAVHATSPGGLPIGSNTGRIRAAQPSWVRRRYAVPDAVMDIDDALVRQYSALRFGIASDVRAITTANPSMLLLLFRRLADWRDALARDLRDGTCRNGPASDIPPTLLGQLEGPLRSVEAPTDWTPSALWDLETVNCWKGGPAAFFADRLSRLLPEVPIRELGVNASEGTFAFPVSQTWPGGVLWVGGHLLEFLDSAGTAHWAWQLELGKQYRIVVSTSAGLWRYDMQDVVEVVGFCEQTPLIRFVGKSGRFLNAVGERVTEAQVSQALKDAGLDLVGFTVGITMGDIPSYVVAFEGEIDPSVVGEALDAGLTRLNVEYQSKRKSGRLGGPTAQTLSPGHYARLRRRTVAMGAPDGQIKDPIVACDDTEWKRVLDGSGSP